MLSFQLPSAEDMRDLQKKAVQSVENGQPEARSWNAEQSGLSKREYVPLAVALFVDLCLFLVSMVQTPRHRLAGLLPKMQNAETGPVIDILSSNSTTSTATSRCAKASRFSAMSCSI